METIYSEGRASVVVTDGNTTTVYAANDIRLQRLVNELEGEGSPLQINDPVVGLPLLTEVLRNALYKDKCKARDAGFSVDDVWFYSDPSAKASYLEQAVQV